jgi:hypothetical protein
MLVGIGLIMLVGFCSDCLITCVSARAVPHRGVKAIFYHIRRAHDSLGKAGEWTPGEDEHLLRYVCLAVSSASTINRASNIELFRRTDVIGLRSQTACCAHLPTAVIDTVSMYNIRIPNVEVRLQHSAVLFTSDAAFVQGAWSPEEESQLLCAIEELAKAGITDTSARGFWVSVSKALGDTRTPKQCRNKWCVIGSTS